VIAARYYRCSHSNAKRSFYTAFNAMFRKIRRCASEEVIIELLKMKCLPVLLYGIESCPYNKTQIKSLDFAISSAFAKYFVLSPRTSLTPVGRYITVSLWLTVYAQGRETFCVNMLNLVMLFVDCL